MPTDAEDALFDPSRLLGVVGLRNSIYHLRLVERFARAWKQIPIYQFSNMGLDHTIDLAIPQARGLLLTQFKLLWDLGILRFG